jgi:hypothetical protein
MASIVLLDMADWSNPEMIDDVGDTPLRDECGYFEVYVPATDIADDGKALAASCCKRRRSFSRVVERLCDFSSSSFVVERSSRRVWS